MVSQIIKEREGTPKGPKRDGWLKRGGEKEGKEERMREERREKREERRKFRDSRRLLMEKCFKAVCH